MKEGEGAAEISLGDGVALQSSAALTSKYPTGDRGDVKGLVVHLGDARDGLTCVSTGIWEGGSEDQLHEREASAMKGRAPRR